MLSRGYLFTNQTHDVILAERGASGLKCQTVERDLQKTFVISQAGELCCTAILTTLWLLMHVWFEASDSATPRERYVHEKLKKLPKAYPQRVSRYMYMI